MPNFQVGVDFDKTQIDQGFDASAASAEQWKNRLAATFEGAATTSQRYLRAISDDTKEMAANVSSSQLRGAESAKSMVAANAELRAAMSLAKGPLGETAEVTSLLAAAQQRAAIAAKVHAAAMEELAGASHVAVSGVQATSAAIRSLEGNAGLRAVENFISKTLGLGPAMQAIFPLIGALAFGKILFDIGEKMVDVEQKAVHAGDAITEEFAGMHDKAQVTNDALAIQNDKLQDEIDKLSGHPNNGLQTALDEARQMADKLLDSLQADRKELTALLKDNEVGALGSLLSGLVNEAPVAGTGQQGKELLADQKNLMKAVRDANVEFERVVSTTTDTEQIKAATDRKNEAVRKAFQSQIDAYSAEEARLRAEQAKSRVESDILGNARAGSSQPIDNSAKIAIIEGRKVALQDMVTHENFIESIDSREQTVGGLKQQGSEDSGGDNKAAEQRLKAMEAELNEEKLQHNLSTKAVFDYWAERRAAFVKGSEQYNQVTAKMAAEAVAGSRAAAEAIKKFKADELKENGSGDSAAVTRGIEDMSKALQKQGEDAAMTGESWNGYFAELAKGKEIAAAMADDITLTQLKSLEAVGGITRLGAAHVEAAMHAQQQARAIAALREELARLEKEAARDPVTGAVSDPKDAAKIASVQNQIAQQQGKGQIQGAQDAAAISAALSKPYLDAFDHINSGWLKVQNDLIAGNRRISRDFAEMGLGLVQSLAANTEKMLADMARGEIKKIALHRATQTATTASAAEGAAQADSISALSALKQMTHSAAVAAGKAWGAFADIPIVGPELGAVAAAATYAGVMALASFDTGTMYVPHDGVAMIHKGESVLPPPQTQVLADALNGGSGGSSGDMHLHMGGNQFSAAGGDFHSQFEAHERKMIGTLKKWHREGKLAFGG